MNKVVEVKLSDIAQVATVPTAQDSKYTRGVVGLITGTDQYPGAGVLSVSAAAHSSIGYVRCDVVPSAMQALLVTCPQVVFDARLDHKVDAWVVGSGFAGLYDTPRDRRVADILAGRYPYANCAFVVIDAGALETFATQDIPVDQRRRCIITPHAGEALRLCDVLGISATLDDIAQHSADIAIALAQRLQCTVVLKGARTIVASHEQCLGGDIIVRRLPLASPWLATAGTGDVLAGIIGACVASHSQRINAGDEEIGAVVSAAVCIHAIAAGHAAGDMAQWYDWAGVELAPESFDAGQHITPMDIVRNIPLGYSFLRQFGQSERDNDSHNDRDSDSVLAADDFSSHDDDIKGR